MGTKVPRLAATKPGRADLNRQIKAGILCSALGGSVLLLLSDVVSRVLIAPTVLPIGALTSFLGAPLFLYLIVKGGIR